MLRLVKFFYKKTHEKLSTRLSPVQEKTELLRSEQANSDLYILSETLKDYIGLFGAIKDVFRERVKVSGSPRDSGSTFIVAKLNPRK